ncbi:helix-turn-helix domain-containing protein [Paenarthrobacter sp. NPDC089316]|uniref:PucR family transcriptional regulator n=1 Tax=unclassified Paenarthrobacter TaxID=2634190 RepID=UPI00343FC2FB
MSPSAESPAQRACRLVQADLDELAERTTVHVRAEVPSYALVPVEVHLRTVRETAAALLVALANGSSASPAHVRAIRYAAMSREDAGVAVQDVLSAFHIVGRDVWEALRATDGIKPTTLVQLVTPLWSWIQDNGSHVAEAFASGSGGLQGRQVVLRQRLLEAVRSGDSEGSETTEGARRLGFVPGGVFRAVCTEAGPWLDGDMESLQKTLTRMPGVCHAGLHGTLMIVLAQGIGYAAVAQEIQRRLHPRDVIGVGLERQGLAGAETSIGDAERALRVGWPGSISVFEKAWLHASLIDARTRLTPLYGQAKAVAQEHPSLAEAIRAFANSGFSLAAAATNLQVHPNTVAYRLDRWQELTGLDPRQFDGLARSVLSTGPPR